MSILAKIFSRKPKPVYYDTIRVWADWNFVPEQYKPFISQAFLLIESVPNEWLLMLNKSNVNIVVTLLNADKTVEAFHHQKGGE